jgi:hypothetical protein
VDCAGLTGALVAGHAALIKGLMRRTAEDVFEIDGRSALHGIRRAFPLHPRLRSRCRPASKADHRLVVLATRRGPSLPAHYVERRSRAAHAAAANAVRDHLLCCLICKSL